MKTHNSLISLTVVLTVFFNINWSVNADHVSSDNIVTTSITRGSAGHVLVDGKINSLPQKIVIDTGGIGVGGLISENVLSKINQVQENSQKAHVQGAHHNKTMNITKIDSAGVPNAMLENLSFVVTPNAVIPDDNIEVLIGSRYLSNFVVEFNLQDNELILYPKNYPIKKIINQNNVQWSTASFDDLRGSGAIILNMLIDSHPVKAILDTGARHSIMNWKAAEIVGLSKSSVSVKSETTSATGVHGNAPKTSYTTNLSSLAVEGNKVRANNMKMHIADMAAFKPLLGDSAGVNLGIDFFDNRRLVIDYANKMIAITE